MPQGEECQDWHLSFQGQDKLQSVPFLGLPVQFPTLSDLSSRLFFIFITLYNLFDFYLFLKLPMRLEILTAMMTLTQILLGYPPPRSTTTTLFSRSPIFKFNQNITYFSHFSVQFLNTWPLTPELGVRLEGYVSHFTPIQLLIIILLQPGLHVEVDESLFGKVHK